MRLAVILLSLSLAAKPKVIGNSEYCAVGKKEIWCTAPNFNFCLHVLSMIPDGYECIENKGKYK